MKPILDRARQKTDKRLNKIEKEIGRMYRTHPALLEVQKEFANYMKMVEKKTAKSYKAYVDETDSEKKAELKKEYASEVEELTLKSKVYNKLVTKIVRALAIVNQEALDIVNDAMIGIYVDNYNQVAVDCKKVGIKVNGEK